MPRKIEISYKTIVFAVLFLAGLWIFYFIREIVLQLFAALLLMAILNPLVTKLSILKIPRAVSVLVVYFTVLGFLILGIAGVTPPLVDQTASFANHLPQYLNLLNIETPLVDQIVKPFLSQIGNLPGEIVKFGFSIVSNILSVVTVLIFAFYLLLGHDRLDSHLVTFFGQVRAEKYGRIIKSLEDKLGNWARGQLTLMLLIGLAGFIALTIIGIPFALPLAILAGLLEIVPYFGPIIACIPAVIIALSISPLTAGITILAFFLINQAENYLFVPKIVEKSVGVSPIITLLALTVGFKLAGVVGVLLSIPFVITTEILVKEYLAAKEG